MFSVCAGQLLFLELVPQLSCERFSSQGVGEHRGELWLLLLDQGLGNVLIELSWCFSRWGC